MMMARHMKLLTHNMLRCTVKGVQNGYPLKIEAQTCETHEAEMNEEFLRHIFPRIEWHALVEGARAMGVEDLPAEASESALEDDEFLKKFHHALLEVDLEEGHLVCPESGRRFNVSKGIPNMLLNEDEV